MCGADKCHVCRKNIHDILGEDSKRKSVSTAGKKLDLWDEFYRGIFRDRAEAIIDSHVKKGVEEVLNTLEAVKDDLKVRPDAPVCMYSGFYSKDLELSIINDMKLI